MSKPKRGLWIGSEPVRCDTCDQPFEGIFVDGKTKMGPWAKLCPRCHERMGVGLGVGLGQRYRLNGDGEWIKTDG